MIHAMHNRLSHGYDTVDHEMVWRTVCNDLPEIYRLIKATGA